MEGWTRAAGLAAIAAVALACAKATLPVVAPPDGPFELARAAEQVVARSSVTLPRAYAQRATSDVDARYGAATTPASIVEGGDVVVHARVTNTGSEPWRAGGPGAVRLSYHWYDANGGVVVWDGPRAELTGDVLPGRVATFDIHVRAPRASGIFYLDWDLVQDGVGWWSSTQGVPMRTERVAVGDGVTLYGKGWGHGIGLSQWGAQGWAEGVTGQRLTGEQIVAKYFPGAELTPYPASTRIRVLLSAPSTGCVGRTIADFARMSSAGGMWVVDDGDPSVVYADVGPDGSLAFSTDGPNVVVQSDATGQVLVQGPGAVTVVPKQWWDPIAIAPKGLAYRGTVKVSARDEGYLRVVNYLSSDDYMKGALPGEMPDHWEIEALRAQAITARTYAAWRQSTAGDRTWDVRDDTADQCYGGHSFESRRTTAAVASTAATILTYDAKPIRALYSSADGGVTENVGCLLDAVRVGSGWECAAGWPYLAVIDDPAEALAYDARGRNPHDDLWSAHFSGDEIRENVAEDYGVDIGAFVAIAFDMSPGGRPVSVGVTGTNGTISLKGDRFLRSTLGLKSTLVRTTVF